jgi:hypothetical protein
MEKLTKIQLVSLIQKCLISPFLEQIEQIDKKRLIEILSSKKTIIDEKYKYLFVDKDGNCPINEKITTTIYSPKNAKLNRYLEYKSNVRVKAESLIKFKVFLTKYYSCSVCSTSKYFIDIHVLYNSDIKYKYPKHLQKKLDSDPPNRTQLEDKFEKKIRRIIVPNTTKTNNYIFLGRGIIDEIKNCKKRYIMIELSLNNGDIKSNSGHANSLIFDVENRTLIRFEPHGTEIFMYCVRSVDKCMRKLVEMLNYKRYISPVEFCPRLGVQFFEKNSKYDDKTGFCSVFSMLFICYILDFPQYSLKQIHSIMFQGENKNPNIKQNDVENKRINVSLEVRLFANLIMRVGRRHISEYVSFGNKRKKKVLSKKLKTQAKKYKVKLTVKRGNKRVYKSEKVLMKQINNAMKLNF